MNINDNKIHCDVQECMHNKDACECTLSRVKISNCNCTTKKCDDTACESFKPKNGCSC